MMIRPLVLSLLFLVSVNTFAANGCAVTILESTNRHIIVEARFNDISFVQKQSDGTWFTDIHLPGAGSMIDPGAPKLPLTTIRLGIPEFSQPQLYILSEQVETNRIGAIKWNDLFDAAEADVQPSLFYPANSADIVLDAVIHQQRVLHVQLYPVRYQARTQTAQILKTIQFKIDFGRELPSTFAAPSSSEPLLEDILDNYESSKMWRRAANPSLGKSHTTLPMAKIFLKNDGVYKVTGYELAQNGIDIRRIDPRTLALSNKGRAVPIIVEGKNDGELNFEDRIIFLGEHNSGDNTHLSFFSDTNVYQLTWGGQGLAFTELPASPKGVETDTLVMAPHHFHFEKDLRYERLVGHDNGDDDHWFWEKLMNGERINFPVSLPGLTPQSTLQLTATFHGLTKSSEVAMNHHVFAYMDDQEIGEAYGSQDKPFSMFGKTFSIDGNHSDRIIHFDLPLDNADVFADFIFLNWFTIDYDRNLRAVNDQLECTLEPQQNRLWRLRGFSSDQVYLLTDTGYRLVQPKIQSRRDGFELLLAFSSMHPATLWAVGDDALRSVSKIEFDEPSNLANSGHRADYVIISHEKFIHSAERLAEYRSQQGLKTMVVAIQDVYDEFSHSLYDPRAIKKFIAHTFSNWRKPAPLYFVLLGDATYLMDKDAAADATLQSYIPSYMINTKSFGMTSSDNYFACVSGDDALPDVYLGRLPANTVDDAEAMINKIVSYETKDIAEEWRRHLTLASGNGDFFNMSAQNLVDNFLPKWLVTSRLSTEYTSPFFNTTEDFVTWMNNGQNIINFLVHGSGEQIADAKLFEKDDILRLNNTDRYAFAVTMSCYIGHFDHPEKNSLGEVLFTTPDRGIMGMFGSAGKSYLYSDYYFNAAVFDGIFSKGWRTLGEITTNAKYELIAQTKGFWEPVHNFLLLGDPATRLNVPQENLELVLSKKVLAEGDQLCVSGSTTSSSGMLHIDAIGRMDSVLVEKSVPVQDSKIDIELMTLTPQLRQKWDKFGGAGHIRAFFSDGQNASVALNTFSVIQPLISSFGIEPEKPAGFEPVMFFCEIAKDVALEVGGITSIKALWTTDQASWSEINLINNENRWVSESHLEHEEGSIIVYKLKIETNAGTVTESDVRDYKVLYKPDVYVDTDISYFENALTVTIKNRGEADAKNVVLNIVNKAEGAPLANDVLIAKIVGREDTTVTVPVTPLTAGTHELEIVVDPENKIAEEEEENNRLVSILHIATPEHGSAESLHFERVGCRLTIPPKSLSASSSIKIVTVDDETLEKSANAASLVFLKSQKENVKLLRIEFADSQMTVSDINLSVQLDTSDSVTAEFLSSGSARLYAWQTQTMSWRGLESQWDGSSLMASLPGGLTTFALLGSADVDAPNITISAQGQNFADGDIVPEYPVFAIALEDASGVDVSPTRLKIWLNGQELHESDYVLTEPSISGLAQISYSPDLTSGDHMLKIQASDVNANIQSKEVTFSIAEKFGLDFIANHPNPFVDETTFAFCITTMASQVDLTIYTVSGRLIRSFEFTDITGYNEIDWDGADRDGNEVANGVYYLKFSARNDEEKIERIERLAKLK